MQVFHAEKNNVEQSRTVPNSQYLNEYLNHTMGLTLATPVLVLATITLVPSRPAPKL